MNNLAATHDHTAHGALVEARALERPSREAMLMRAPSVQQFWNDNAQLLRDAWSEWEESVVGQLQLPDDSLLDSKLRTAVTQAWNNPEHESAVRDLLTEVSPDVFMLQFFDPERLTEFREYLEAIWNAQIPMRPPYGIALNRGGAMLDLRSEGSLAAPGFQAFYQALLDTYMRPISRLLFPEIIGYDAQSFGFSIRYQAGVDTSLRPHTDASSVTLNINLNKPDEAFTGSFVDFYDNANGEVNRLSFKPGTAMLHRGNVPHAAQPITSGERTNIVLWLFGERGQIPPHDAPRKDIDAASRWTTPVSIPDGYAPF